MIVEAQRLDSHSAVNLRSFCVSNPGPEVSLRTWLRCRALQALRTAAFRGPLTAELQSLELELSRPYQRTQVPGCHPCRNEARLESFADFGNCCH